MLPVRLRDFIIDRDDWIYSVAAYDNAERVGGILRYLPDPSGERCSGEGRRYRVGRATTRTVVTSAVLTLILDYMLTAVLL